MEEKKPNANDKKELRKEESENYRTDYRGNRNGSNSTVITLLIVLIVAVLGVGGYFVVKDAMDKDDDNDSGHSREIRHDDEKRERAEATEKETEQTEDTNSETSNEIEAVLSYAEVRGNDFYVEVQANGQVTGKCDISVMPTNGGEGHHDDDDLEILNKVSVCSEDFSLKGMNPGEHKVTVVIRATDGRTKTLEKIVNI